MKNLYERLLSLTQDGVYRYGFDDGIVLLVNQSLLKILDLDITPGEAIGKQISELIQYTETPGELRKRLLAQKSLRGVEYHFKTLKGDDRWVLHDSVLVVDPETGMKTVDAIVKDVTDIRKTSLKNERIIDALRTSEANYHQLFTGMLTAFALHEIICDPEGTPVDYRFLEINPRFEEMTGLKAADLIGRTVKDVLPNSEEVWIRTYGEVALTGKTCHFERYSAALDRYYEVTAYQAAPGRFATFFNDITEKRKAEETRKQMEAQLLQVQKLESLGVLAGGIAHDFNNLLTGILGNASLALADIPEGAPAHQSLRQIELASHRAADLCRQLLAYSGQGRFVVEPVNLSELVGEMGNLLNLSISKKAFLHCTLEPNLPAILGDATQLRQVIMNLIVNASEAIGDREGNISVSTSVRNCDRECLRDVVACPKMPEGRYVHVSVSDTGDGMAADILPRIFDPFFSTKFTGRGLGLAAVMGIVRSHQGAIKIRSETGRGSEFILLFPAITETATPRVETQPGPPLAPFTGTVLVVDDDEIVLSIASRALEKMGARVLKAKDGVEAVERFTLHWKEIRLVLLDMTMPRMNGEETFRELRRIDPDCVVILSSGYTEQEAVGRFAGQGLAGFLQKPYRMKELRAKIAEVLPPSRNC